MNNSAGKSKSISDNLIRDEVNTIELSCFSHIRKATEHSETQRQSVTDFSIIQVADADVILLHCRKKSFSKDNKQVLISSEFSLHKPGISDTDSVFFAKQFHFFTDVQNVYTETINLPPGMTFVS